MPATPGWTGSLQPARHVTTGRPRLRRRVAPLALRPLSSRTAAWVFAALLAACGHADVTGPGGNSAVTPQVVSGNGFSCALTDTGVAYCWGRNNLGQLGRGSMSPSGSPAPVAGDYRFHQLAAGDRNVCGLTADGIVCWGNGGLFLLVDPVPTPTAVTTPNHPFQTVSVGYYYACALATAGDGWCWGDDSYGQLGNGTQLPSISATLVLAHVAFTELSAGTLHACGLASGDVWCWGSNRGRPIGNGVQPNALVLEPHQVSLPFAAHSIAAGSGFTCTLDGAGRAWCWGRNEAGQLGSGSASEGSGDAQPVGAPAGLTALIASSTNRVQAHACALTADGQAWCWGADGAGQLGRAADDQCEYNGAPFACSPQPAPVDTDLRFQQVAVGFDHTCGQTPDGAVYCWGSDQEQQLGGTVGGTSIAPVRIVLGS